jgi:hypothetical protein
MYEPATAWSAEPYLFESVSGNRPCFHWYIIGPPGHSICLRPGSLWYGDPVLLLCTVHVSRYHLWSCYPRVAYPLSAPPESGQVHPYGPLRGLTSCCGQSRIPPVLVAGKSLGVGCILDPNVGGSNRDPCLCLSGLHEPVLPGTTSCPAGKGTSSRGMS